jgi:subfamily B ATP-binding cassette protein MsbA
MNNLKQVLGFARIYLRRYQRRLLLAILMGLLFGLSNASFVWAAKTLIGRLAGETAVTAKIQKAPSPFARNLNAISKTVNRWIDPWLPLKGRALDWRMVAGGILFLPMLVAVRSTADFLNSYHMGWVSERVSNDLRFDVLSKLSTLSLDFFNRAATGDLLTRITGDTTNLQRTLRVGAADLVKESFTLVSVFIGLLLIDPKLTLVGAIFLPACIAPLLILSRKLTWAVIHAWKAGIAQSNQLVEFFTGIRVIKAFSLEEERLHRFHLQSKQQLRHGMKGVKAKELVNPVIEIISMFGIGALIIYIFITQRSVPDLVGFMTGMIFLFVPIRKLAGVHLVFQQASPSVDRLTKTLQEIPTVKEPNRPKPVPAFRSELALEGVTFSYGAKPVLSDVNLVIPRGHKLGVAGESGSGKSTLVNLLFRFYDPTHGTIRIDGVDLREAASHDFRNLMALVSQEIVLFNQTVAENIVCGKPGATREEVETAGRNAFAHGFISQLPHGYDTMVGERGMTLSGGQRQRIAIARAFIRNAPILVLDEATASLDSQSEAEVQAAIDRLSENRTVICVAHRLSTLASCDRIIVLLDGRIVEEGTFAELLHHGDLFALMAWRQGILSPHHAKPLVSAAS